MQQGSRGGAQLTIILSDTPVPRPAIGSYVGQGSERDLNPQALQLSALCMWPSPL